MISADGTRMGNAQLGVVAVVKKGMLLIVYNSRPFATLTRHSRESCFGPFNCHNFGSTVCTMGEVDPFLCCNVSRMAICDL